MKVSVQPTNMEMDIDQYSLTLLEPESAICFWGELEGYCRPPTQNDGFDVSWTYKVILTCVKVAARYHGPCCIEMERGSHH
jgi:hypothetical protein